MKRVIDILGSIMGIIIFCPFLLVISIVVKLQDLGPVFFKQQRIGQYGKTFHIYKFRTMVVNAEKILRNSPGLYEQYVNAGFYLPVESDSRITWVGRFLRRSSLDELPQLYNVLKGQMSLVGPRPIIDEEINHYGETKADFLSFKPGLTGYWQAWGRDNVTYPERVDMELFYIRNYNLWLDFKIICKTISSVLRGVLKWGDSNGI